MVVANWTMQATMYANWKGISVATEIKRIKVVRTLRLGLFEVNAGA